MTGETIPQAANPTLSRGSAAAFWASTLFVAMTALVAGAADILHLQPLYGILLHLGYPPYFAAILGTWKVLGALALLAPRRPLVKEWAYAGMSFDYASAVASHCVSGDGLAAMAGPLISIAVLIASWRLRPQSRRLSAGWR
jgi:hypothetical protein